MFFTIILLQIVTNYLALYLSNNIRPYDPFAIESYGRIAYHPPPPTPQIYYPTSADYADEYKLLSLTNITIPISPPPFLNNAYSFDKPTRTDSSLRTSSLPRLLGDALHGVGQIVSWIFAAAVVIITAALQVLAAVGPPASAAYVLCERRSRDLEELKMTTVSSLVPVMLAGMVYCHSRVTSDLEAQLRSAEAALRTTIDSLEMTVFELQAQIVNQIAGLKVTLKTTITEADKRQRDQGAKINSLEATLQTTITEADKRERDQAALTAKIKSLEDTVLKNIADTMRFDEAQRTAEQRILQLEDEQKSGRERIQSLMATIISNRRELQMYCDEDMARRKIQQADYHQHRQPFTPPPPQPMGFPHPPAQPPVGSHSLAQYPIATVPLQGQSPFAARQSPLGFPPNQRGGFMGNAPPSPQGGGRADGAGSGSGSNGGAERGEGYW